MNKDIYQAFLELVRIGICNRSCGLIPEVIEWQIIKTIADQHGLTAVVLDAIEKLPDTKRPSQEFLLNWIGEVLQCYEQRYE